MKKIIFLGLILVVVATGCTKLGSKTTEKVLTLEEAKAKAVEFVNTNLMQPGSTVSIKEASEEDGMYKLVINMSSGQEVTSYITKDGKKFFPQVMDIAEIEGKNQNADQPDSQPQAAANVPKAEKAKVELFVMSHCPYGTQIEKGILPAVKTLGDKVDFELKFCDYAMHGKKELDEQLNQHCIQKNEPNKLYSYLDCFLEADDGAGCLIKTKINTSKLNVCVKAIDQEYKVTELFNDKSTWTSGRFPQFNVDKTDVTKYGVKGSPGLVINGEKISSGRDAASLLKVICNGYENPPAECLTELSSAAPSPGFGGGTGSDTAAGCGT